MPTRSIPVALRALDRRVEHVVHERRLARAADAGDARSACSSGIVDVDVLQVVLGRAEQRGSSGRCRCRRVGGTGIASSSRRYFAVSERGSCISPSSVPENTTRPPCSPAPSPMIDDVIGDLDHVGVVLDDEDGVALIAQLPQDVDQPLVVARVQADRRLVEHVERADQRRAERRRQVDALRLRRPTASTTADRASGSRGRRRAGTTAAGGSPCSTLSAIAASFSRQRERRRRTAARRAPSAPHTSSIVRPPTLHVARLAPQPRAAAVRAGQVAAVAAEEHADVHLVFLPLEPAEEAADARRSSPSPSMTNALLVVGQLRPRHVEPEPALLAPRASARRAARGSAACSTARSRPAWIDFVGSGTTRSMSSSMMLPKPWQVGQAPNGLLNENSRGCGSRRRCRTSRHSKRSLRTRCTTARLAGRRGELRSRTRRRRLRGTRSRSSRSAAARRSPSILHAIDDDLQRRRGPAAPRRRRPRARRPGRRRAAGRSPCGAALSSVSATGSTDGPAAPAAAPAVVVAVSSPPRRRPRRRRSGSPASSAAPSTTGMSKPISSRVPARQLAEPPRDDLGRLAHRLPGRSCGRTCARRARSSSRM